ncbi:hypothetical protein ACS0TY_012173 [Phlomoides rotata]
MLKRRRRRKEEEEEAARCTGFTEKQLIETRLMNRFRVKMRNHLDPWNLLKIVFVIIVTLYLIDRLFAVVKWLAAAYAKKKEVQDRA